VAIRDPKPTKIKRLKVRAKKKAIKRGPLPNEAAYQNANERAAFKRKATTAVKSIRQEPGSKEAVKKAVIKRIPGGKTAMQDRKINVKPGTTSGSRINGPVPVIGTPNGGSKVMLPPASAKPILPNRSGSGSFSSTAPHSPMPVIGTPTGGSKVMPPKGEFPATTKPIKPGVNSGTYRPQNSGETAKNLNAPGQKKKALGLQNARTLTKPAMRTVAKPPAPATARIKVKPTLRSPKSR